MNIEVENERGEIHVEISVQNFPRRGQKSLEGEKSHSFFITQFS